MNLKHIASFVIHPKFVLANNAKGIGAIATYIKNYPV